MKTVIIVPYFGEFPNYFQVFLNSCKYNIEFEWLIYTDNTKKYNYPENVIIKKMTFEEMKVKIRKKFDFDFDINSVHKLCDLKPAYGYIFEEDIKNYDFWGFGDIDVILGDLSHFITKEMFIKYDKIYTVGHLTLFRNNYENNRRFMLAYKGELIYRNAFLKTRESIFDEGFKNSINNIYEDYNFPMCTKFEPADIYTKSSNFRLVGLKNDRELVIYKNKKGVFWWKKGQLLFIYMENDKFIKQEFPYIHLQKRKMRLKGSVTKAESIKIVPNVFEEQFEDITEENFKKIKKKYFNLHYFKLRTKNLIYKIKVILKLIN